VRVWTIFLVSVIGTLVLIDLRQSSVREFCPCSPRAVQMTVGSRVDSLLLGKQACCSLSRANLK
jgi:hypothetical protein